MNFLTSFFWNLKETNKEYVYVSKNNVHYTFVIFSILWALVFSAHSVLQYSFNIGSDYDFFARNIDLFFYIPFWFYVGINAIAHFPVFLKRFDAFSTDKSVKSSTEYPAGFMTKIPTVTITIEK